jgi:diguanylate cyclase (GGDEF)-like protein
MSALTKEQTYSGSQPVTLRQGWDIFEGCDLMDLRIALNQAETVIRAQKDRIRELEERTLTDELTQLANRRGFSVAFKRELAMARRDTDYGGILVMIDLEGFKLINNAWGHQTGDAYLRAVAEVLRTGVRANDTVAYLGDDKFALLLTHMDEVTGVKRLAKLEKALGKKTVLPESLPLQASFGFAAYTGTSCAEAVMQTADLRLTARKSRTRESISVD